MHKFLCSESIAHPGSMRYSGMDANLPDLNELDREGLLALLLSQHQQLVETQQRLASRESEIAHLKLLIAKLQRLQFGRRSEKVQRQIEQLELRLEELETNKAAESTSHAPAGVTPTFGTKPRRGPLPDHLPREVRRREPKETVCPGCGGELRKIGEDVSEMLEHVPEKFKVIRQVRPKLSAPHVNKSYRHRRKRDRSRMVWQDLAC